MSTRSIFDSKLSTYKTLWISLARKHGYFPPSTSSSVSSEASVVDLCLPISPSQPSSLRLTTRGARNSVIHGRGCGCCTDYDADDVEFVPSPSSTFIDDDVENSDDSDFTMTSPQSQEKNSGRQQGIIYLGDDSDSDESAAPPIAFDRNKIISNLSPPIIEAKGDRARGKIKRDQARRVIDASDDVGGGSSASMAPCPLLGTPEKLNSKNRGNLLKAAFNLHNKAAFSSQLSSVSVSFSNKLLTTAGITRLKRKANIRSCSIELSTKVITDTHRLHQTLLHEMCHAAQFLISNAPHPPHGPAFQKWTKNVNRVYPNVHISTCHSYDIEYKYVWTCTSSFCGQIIKRHSRSLNVETQRCGACNGTFVEIDAEKYFLSKENNGPTDRTPVKKKAASKYNLFVKERIVGVRSSLVDPTSADVMKELGRLWKEEKSTYEPASPTVRAPTAKPLNNNKITDEEWDDLVGTADVIDLVSDDEDVEIHDLATRLKSL